MGQEILYCHQCGTRLVSDDFTRGRAHTLERRSYCAACVQTTISAPSPTAPTRLQGKPPTAPASTGSPKPLILGLAVIGVMLIAGIVAVLGSGRGTAAPTDTVVAPAGPKLDAELKALHQRVDGPAKLEQFGAAIGMLEEARKLHDEPEWITPIDQRIRGLRDLLDVHYKELRDQAAKARTRGDTAEFDRLQQRVAQWGMPTFSLAFETDMAGVKVAPPLPFSGLRLVPSFADAGRIQRRHGVTGEKGVEAVPYGPIRIVGWEGDLFPVPSDGEVQVTIWTDSAQPVQIKLRILGEQGQSIAFDWMVRNPSVGKAVQVKAPFREFREGARQLPVGSVIKALFVAGHDPKVTFRVTELTVVKRRD